jgi:replicative DNA helicase
MYIYESDKIVYKDFYQKEHSFIYEAIQQLWSVKKTIDVVTLSDQLDKN